jgi:hypothetical protein
MMTYLQWQKSSQTALPREMLRCLLLIMDKEIYVPPFALYALGEVGVK